MVKIEVNDFDTRLESNYENIRYHYEEYLYDMGYSRQVISETKDGRDVYCKSEYDIYLENLGCSQ